jgi:hypothetical protein
MEIVEIKADQIKRAETLYPFNELNGSITKGSGNIYGALGEILIYDFFVSRGFDVDFKSTYDYDLIINTHKVDVKSKRTTVEPKGNYLCSISSFNTGQKCDFYFFCRIREDMKFGYLLGFKGKNDFFDQATFNKKGDADINGWLFKNDCYNLEISKLNQFKS